MVIIVASKLINTDASFFLVFFLNLQNVKNLDI